MGPLFDRLAMGWESDLAPRSGSTSSRSDGSRIRSSLRRELNSILNTRQPVDPSSLQPNVPSGDPLQGTLARYGLPDITQLDLLREQDRNRLRDWLSAAVSNFEPRLCAVEVTWLDTGESADRVTFRLTGEIRSAARSEELRFQGEILWRTREVRLL